jgi:hypothetical protein
MVLDIFKTLHSFKILGTAGYSYFGTPESPVLAFLYAEKWTGLMKSY